MKRETLPHRHPHVPGDRAHRYESAKAQWVAAHPFATSKEYEAAIRAICKRIGY